MKKITLIFCLIFCFACQNSTFEKNLERENLEYLWEIAMKKTDNQIEGLKALVQRFGEDSGKKVLKRIESLKDKQTIFLYKFFLILEKDKERKEENWLETFFNNQKLRKELSEKLPLTQKYIDNLLAYPVGRDFASDKQIEDIKNAQKVFETELSLNKWLILCLHLTNFVERIIIYESCKINEQKFEIPDLLEEKLTILESLNENMKVGQEITLLLAPSRHNHRQYKNLSFKINGKTANLDYESQFFEYNGFVLLRFVAQQAGKYEISGQVEINYLWREKYEFDHEFKEFFEVNP